MLATRARMAGGQAGLILVPKGFGYHTAASPTADLRLSYATVAGGEGPAAGDLAIWHVWAQQAGSSPFVNLAASGWTETAVQTNNPYHSRGLAKLLSGSDISSPPICVDSPSVTSIGFWTCFTVLVGSVAGLTIDGKDHKLGSGISAVNAVDDVALDLSALQGVMIASSLLLGADDSLDQGWSGDTPSGTCLAVDAFNTDADGRHSWKLYGEGVPGKSILSLGGDNGHNNFNSVFYVRVS